MFKIELPKFKNVLTTTALVTAMVGVPIVGSATELVDGPEETMTANAIEIAPFNVSGMGTTVLHNGTNLRSGQWVSFRHRTGSWTSVRIETGVNQGRIGYIQTNLLSSNWIW